MSASIRDGAKYILLLAEDIKSERAVAAMNQ